MSSYLNPDKLSGLGAMPALPITLVTPLNREARIGSMDVLRGFALLGILVLNIGSFSGPNSQMGHDVPIPSSFSDAHGTINLFFFCVQWLFFEGKMRALFSMLFGAGVILLTKRLESRDPTLAADIYFRRNMWLMIIGAIHGTLIWEGDILLNYGYAAVLFLYPFRNVKASRLIVPGVILVFMFDLGFLHAVNYLPNVALSQQYASIAANQKAGLPVTAEQDTMEKKWEKKVSDKRFNPKVYQSDIKNADSESYIDYVLNKGSKYVADTARSAVLGVIFEPFGLMVIGMVLFKTGFFSAKLSRRTYAVIGILGSSISISLTAFCISKAYSAGFFFLSTEKWLLGLAYPTSQLTGAIADAAWIILLIKSGFCTKLLGRLAAVGQTALSNYLLTSLLCQTIFIWGPWKLFGTLEFYQTFYVVAVVWFVNIIASSLWLKAFEFGPVEWVWRSLTYWKLQPMRRAARIG